MVDCRLTWYICVTIISICVLKSQLVDAQGTTLSTSLNLILPSHITPTPINETTNSATKQDTTITFTESPQWMNINQRLTANVKEKHSNEKENDTKNHINLLIFGVPRKIL